MIFLKQIVLFLEYLLDATWLVLLEQRIDALKHLLLPFFFLFGELAFVCLVFIEALFALKVDFSQSRPSFQ